MTRALVTGAAGFIGSYVTERLLAQGCDVLAIDNLSFGRQEHVDPRADFWQLDLATTDSAKLAQRVADFGPHFVIHLAAIHFIPYCIDHPDETFASNVRASEVVARAAALAGTVQRLVVASSMDVYAPSDVKHRESDVPSPRNVYGLSKLLTEKLSRYVAETVGQLSAVCLRFANVYGPRETNPHLIPDTLERVLDMREPTIRMGNLAASRDFIHVSDVADAIVMFAVRPSRGYDVFNLGSGITTPVRSIVEFVRKVAQDPRPIVEDKQKFRNFDRKSLTPDISKVVQLTPWRPKISIEEGLQALVQDTLTSTRRPMPGERQWRPTGPETPGSPGA